MCPPIIAGGSSFDHFDDYNSSKNNRESKRSVEEKKLEEKIANTERVESFLSSWNNNQVTTITIINKDRFKEKLVKYLSLGIINPDKGHTKNNYNNQR